MCTVVCRWQPGAAAAGQAPVQMLALRDELSSRAYDLPDTWWPQQPDVVGGRDRTAGGTWCVTDVATSATGVVLNRPERRVAAPGAPSRGVLPLLAVQHGEQWVDHVDVGPMASFNLVLVSPAHACWWSFDGSTVQHQELGAGTHMFTPLGLRSEIDPRLLAAAPAADPEATGPVDELWGSWLAVVRTAVPGTGPTDLVVQREFDGDSYETVFGQLIAARPGVLRLDYLARPARNPRGDWATRVWRSAQVP
jgi:hypothetical protein